MNGWKQTAQQMTRGELEGGSWTGSLGGGEVCS